MLIFGGVQKKTTIAGAPIPMRETTRKTSTAFVSGDCYLLRESTGLETKATAVSGNTGGLVGCMVLTWRVEDDLRWKMVHSEWTNGWHGWQKIQWVNFGPWVSGPLNVWYLGGGFKYVLFSPLLGEDSQIFFRWVETTNQMVYLPPFGQFMW